MTLHRADSSKMRVPKKPLAIAAVEDERRATTFGGTMKHIASILTGFSLAVLFFVASAHAQSGLGITASIPCEFTVGNISLPAGQYEFLSAGDNIFQIRGANRRSLFTLSSAPIEA